MSNPTPKQGPAIVAKRDIPDIQIGSNVVKMTAQAMKALANHPNCFQRGGQLVHYVRRQNRPNPIDGTIPIRPTSEPVIKALERDTLFAWLSDVAKWVRYKDGAWHDSLPEAHVAGDILKAGEWPDIRTLVSVVTAPTLRPDGTILQTRGYDAATGLVYDPGHTVYPVVDDEPTRDQCIYHRDALAEVARDFPFAKRQHFSAWLAGVLTTVARAAIDGPCPLFAVDATARGTGKSKLVHAAARIAFGQDASVMPPTSDDDENRKRITSILSQGDPFVLIDNVATALGGASLDAVLTSTMWSDRVLGSNTTVKVPNLALWWATGNNLTLQGDLARRTLQIRMESMVENPEDRTNFRHPDLLGWVSHERAKLVVNALSILRGYFVAGKPMKPASPWGSFEAWSEIIPGCIRWLDLEDPLLARATADEMLDEQRMNLVTVILAIEKLNPKRDGMTARSMIQFLFPPRDRNEPAPNDQYSDMREVIESVTRTRSGYTPDSIRFGKFLAKNRGRVIMGRRIERATTDSDSNSVRWTVVPAETRTPEITTVPVAPMPA